MAVTLTARLRSMLEPVMGPRGRALLSLMFEPETNPGMPWIVRARYSSGHELTLYKRRRSHAVTAIGELASRQGPEYAQESALSSAVCVPAPFATAQAATPDSARGPDLSQKGER